MPIEEFNPDTDDASIGSGRPRNLGASRATLAQLGGKPSVPIPEESDEIERREGPVSETDGRSSPTLRMVEPAKADRVVEGYRHTHVPVGLDIDTHPSDVEDMGWIVRIPHASGVSHTCREHDDDEGHGECPCE